jgi:hypothetical protein
MGVSAVEEYSLGGGDCLRVSGVDLAEFSGLPADHIAGERWGRKTPRGQM